MANVDDYFSEMVLDVVGKSCLANILLLLFTASFIFYLLISGCFMYTFPAQCNIKLIAHRGQGPTSVLGAEFPQEFLPENTLEAFEAALKADADGIELDIFLSKDQKAMVIHDNELWKNVYGCDRSGITLPLGETRNSFQVNQKTYSELKKLDVGHGKAIPTLEEVLQLISSYNRERLKEEKQNLILNIELKDKEAGKIVLEVCNQYIGQSIEWKDIIFCSFNHECLTGMKRYNIGNPLQLAPCIRTATLFGRQNVDAQFCVLPGTPYSQEGLRQIHDLVTSDSAFVAYDVVLWDIKHELIEQVKKDKKQFYISTSDFREFKNKAFIDMVLKVSTVVPVYFKIDAPQEMKEILKDRAYTLYILTLERKLIKILTLKKEAQCNEDSLSATKALLPKPTPFSQKK